MAECDIQRFACIARQEVLDKTGSEKEVSLSESCFVAVVLMCIIEHRRARRLRQRARILLAVANAQGALDSHHAKMTWQKRG